MNTDGIYHESYFSEECIEKVKKNGDKLNWKDLPYSCGVLKEIDEHDWKVVGIKQFECKLCGSNLFEVATGICLTVIRCAEKCGYEVCVHEG